MVRKCCPAGLGALGLPLQWLTFPGLSKRYWLDMFQLSIHSFSNWMSCWIFREHFPGPPELVARKTRQVRRNSKRTASRAIIVINSTLLRCVRFRSEQSCAGIFIHSSLFQQAPPQNILRGGGYCSKEFGRPRTTAAAMADNCWVCTVEMHARRGAEITWIYPEEDASATRRAVFEAELPFACLGEASSSRARDVRDAAARVAFVSLRGPAR